MARIAPVDLEKARRSRAGAPHGVDRREVLRQQLLAHPFVELAAEELGLLARGIRELLRTHVFRRRVDEVAHQAHGLRHVEGLAHAWRGFELEIGGLALRLAIARELVAAEVPCEGGLLGRDRDRALAERIARARQLE